MEITLTIFLHNRQEYYRKASYIGDAPVPSDVIAKYSEMDGSQSAIGDNEGHTETQPQPAAAGLEKQLDRTLAKQRLAREQMKDRFIKATSRIAAQRKNAIVASATKVAAKANIAAGGLTGPAPTSIPSVVPQSATMKKYLASRTVEKDNANVTTGVMSGVRSTSGSAIKATDNPSMTGVISNPLEQAKQQEAINIDYAQSCCEAGDYKGAGEALKTIPESSRTVQVYLMLIRITRNKGTSITEKTCWEFIAEMQPLAIEAYVQLLRSQVPLAIVLNMVPSNFTEKSWMKTYLHGMDNLLRMKYPAALLNFSELNERYPDNIDIKLRMALCLRWMDKTVRACFVYSQVRKLDNRVVEDMYHYGACLKLLSKRIYLNKLASDLLSCSDNCPDVWCVQAMYWDMKGNKERALQMVSKALLIKPNHCGALQLRGQLYMDITPLKALQSFREAYRIEKDIVTYEGLVNTYILMDRQLEAMEMASEVKRLMPDNARAIAIYAMAVYHASDDSAKVAQELLQEALRIDPGCVDAAACLVMIYERQGEYDDAIQVLDQQLDHQPPEVIHIRKAELYTAIEQWEQALGSYQNVLSADPDNARAKAGIAVVEKVISGGEDEDEDEESENNDEHDIEALEAELQRHNQMEGNLDEDDILTGEEDHEDDHDDDSIQYRNHQHHQQTPQHPQNTFAHRARGGLGQRHQQTPYRHPQRLLDQTPHQPSRSQSLLLNQIPSTPGFGMGYPQTPSRPGRSQHNGRFHTTFNAQREREYDEFEDGGEDMDE
ncbi:Anaphase-promoting complex subunit 7 [Dissophora ornata]|nr:Anaphase-promoting complex subunit 7 [Dissophora ornata]